MSNADKLKKRAAEFESKRQNDKAIATYLELFEEWRGEDAANIEVGLFNRAGDIMLREGNLADAVVFWERAADLYAEGGFQNNAIALCNKILRHAPGRAPVYYMLGRMSAQKGFRGDAKKYFLEYVDRKQQANEIDEAFRALTEFADLCPDEHDVRRMLAEQLSRLGRNTEAIEQFQLLYGRYAQLEDDASAATVLARMRAIDPAVEPTAGGPRRSTVARGLVFLDLEDPHPTVAAPTPPQRSPVADASSAARELSAPPPLVPRDPAGLELAVAETPGLDASVLPVSDDVHRQAGDEPPLGLETTAAVWGAGDHLVALDPFTGEGQILEPLGASALRAVDYPPAADWPYATLEPPAIASKLAGRAAPSAASPQTAGPSGIAPAAAPAPESTRPRPVTPDDGFVSLGDWLREGEGPKSTRLVVDTGAPSGDEDADFKDMLRKFKQGVAEHVEEEDHESHYDLGVAFKEMGLVDEAIAEFQKAARGTTKRARIYEALGQCFSEKGQTHVAMTILQRALAEPGLGDDRLVGVLYLLGAGAEAVGQRADAITYFQRVLAVDITFRDVAARLTRLEQVCQ